MSELCRRARELAEELEPVAEGGMDASILSVLRASAARIEALEAACLEARAVFQEYVRLHRAKNPPDEEKAQRNFEHADRLGVALGDLPATEDQ